MVGGFGAPPLCPCIAEGLDSSHMALQAGAQRDEAEATENLGQALDEVGQVLIPSQVLANASRGEPEARQVGAVALEECARPSCALSRPPNGCSV